MKFSINFASPFRSFFQNWHKSTMTLLNTIVHCAQRDAKESRGFCKLSINYPNNQSGFGRHNIRELKQATFLSTRTSTGSKPRRYRWRMVASAVLVWNHERESWMTAVVDFKRERLTPLSSIIYLEIGLSPKKCGKKHGGFPFLRNF